MCLSVSQLDQFAQVHHGHAIRNMPDRSQVMRDKQVSQILFALEFRQQIHDLRLDGNIKRGDRLVGNNEIRVDGERASDADALSLAAGELMWDSA